MDRCLLVNLLFKGFDSSLENICGCYKSLFKIFSKTELEDILENAYNAYHENKNEGSYERWFGDFHKSIRQIDYFKGCSKASKISLLEQTEIDEFNTIVKSLNSKWKSVKDEQRKLNPNIWRYDYFKLAVPEIYARYSELKAKHNNIETKEIGSNLDVILWNLIAIDSKETLRLILLRAFKEHDLELEMLEELLKISDEKIL